MDNNVDDNRIIFEEMNDTFKNVDDSLNRLERSIEKLSEIFDTKVNLPWVKMTIKYIIYNQTFL